MLPELRHVRAVLFDAVGTLIFPHPPVAEAYHLTAWSFGSQLEPTKISRRFALAIREEHMADVSGANRFHCPQTGEAAERERWRRIVRKVIDDVPAADQERLFQSLWHHFAQPEHWRLFDDVPAVWQALAARGFLVGIASNFDGRLRSVLRGHPPLSGCQMLFVSSQIGYPKPSAEFFARIEQQLQLDAEQILLVGDDEVSDLQGARAAGWQGLLLRRGVPPESAECIQSLADLLDLLPREPG